MKLNLRLLSIVLVSLLFIGTSCKKEEDIIEETFGTNFSVNGDASWSTTAMTTTTVGDQVVITIDHNDERIILTVKEYVKGKYTIDQSSTAATFNFTKSDISAAYTATISPDNYIELTNIHSDATKYDGKFSFTAIDKNFNVKNFSGSWINAKKY